MKHTVKYTEVTHDEEEIELEFPIYFRHGSERDDLGVSYSKYENPDRRIRIAIGSTLIPHGVTYELSVREEPMLIARLEDLLELVKQSEEVRPQFKQALEKWKEVLRKVEP